LCTAVGAAGAAGFALLFIAPVVTAVAATAGFDFDSAEIVVSPVETLSTGVAGCALAVIEVEVAVESTEATTVLSDFAASLFEQAVAKPSTLPTRMTRPTSDTDGERESSKQRFFDMLFAPVQYRNGWSLSAWCLL